MPLRPTCHLGALLLSLLAVACGGKPEPEGAPVATKLAFRTQPNHVVAGTAFGGAIEVVALDASGAVVTDANVSVDVRLEKTGAQLEGTRKQTTAAGVARFTDLRALTAGFGMRLVASSSGLTPATSTDFSVVAGPAASLALTGMPAQVVAGESPALTIELFDAYGNRATTFTGQVALSSSDLQAALTAVPFDAVDEGRKTLSTGVVLKTAGDQTVTASLSGGVSSSTQPTRVVAAAPAGLRFLGQPQDALVRQTLTPAVTVGVVDAFGNPTAGATGNVALSLHRADGLPTGAGAVAAISDGIATFPSLAIADEGAGYRYEASVSGLSTGTSAAFSVSDPFAPDIVQDLSVVSATGRVAVLGFTAPGDDGMEGRASSYELRVSPSPITDEASFLAATQITTGAPGDPGTAEAISLTGLSPSTLYHAVVRVHDGAGNQSTSPAFVFTTPRSVVTSIAFLSAPPAELVAGQTFPLSVEVLDDAGFRVTDWNPELVVSVADPSGILAQMPPQAIVDGVLSLPAAALYDAGADQVITVSQGEVSVSSGPITVLPGPLQRFELALPATVTAGVGVDFDVRASDAYGNAVIDYAGTVHFTSSDAGAVLPTDYTFTADDAGVHTFQVELRTAGTRTLDATDAANASLTGRASVDVGAAPAAELRIAAAPTSGRVREVLDPLEVQVVDAFGNVIPEGTHAIEVAFSGGDSAAILSGTVARDTASGVASFADLSIDTEGAGYSLTVSSDGFSPVSTAAFEVIDDVPPATPSLSVTGFDDVALTLGWSEVGDDGVLGNASSWELRYALAPISTEAQFSAASVAGTGVPGTPGTSEVATATGLTPDTQYFFALRVYDSAGMVSQATASARTQAAGPCVTANPCTAPPSECAPDGYNLVSYTATCDDSTGTALCTNSETPSACASVCYQGACEQAVTPAAGELEVSEVMHSPSVGTTEYVELHNTSDAFLDLDQVVVAHRNPDDSPVGTFTIDGQTTRAFVPPHGFFVLAQNGNPATNGGVTSDREYGSTFSIANEGKLVLTRGATALANLAYSTAFPQTPGKAMSLSSVVSGTTASAQPWYWCDATDALDGGDLGSPGAANGDCGVVVSAPVDGCNVQFPKSISLKIGLAQTFFGRVYEPSVTDRNTSGNDRYPYLEVEFGYGADATLPETWTWQLATANAAYAPASSNDDEHRTTRTFSTAGNFAYGFRARLFDPGTQTWSEHTYCGVNGVVGAGPSAADWGVLTVTP